MNPRNYTPGIRRDAHLGGPRASATIETNFNEGRGVAQPGGRLPGGAGLGRSDCVEVTCGQSSQGRLTMPEEPWVSPGF
jgi:hypothetical protein